jgi:hypothetical protein
MISGVRRLISGLFFLVGLSSVFSQQSVSGKVVDSKTKSPLAFVSVLVEGTNSGALSDIDGKFTLTVPPDKAGGNLIFHYLGYTTTKVAISAIRDNPDFRIGLKSTAYSLDEVKVQLKENPAHRIIKNVTANRDQNNPEKMRSFSYVSYNKMFVTADLKEKADTATRMDTTKQKGFSNFLKKQHLFLTESVTERKYRHPGRNNEKILASRVSGFKNSPFTMMATQMQSFSFYNDFITVFDKHYLNPVSEGSTKKYFFQIEDTLYQGRDSVFIISFRPRKGKNFDGMKGQLYIHTNGWAIQNVIAEPVDKQGAVSIKIQQMYERKEDTQWFPVQLNTDWIYMNTTVGDSSLSVGNTENTGEGKIKAIGRTYISEIKLNPEVKKREFSEVEIEMNPDADSRSEEFWKKYRTDTLTKKDEATYKTIDSIGKKENFDRKLLFYEALGTGKWNWKYIDFDLGRVLNANAYEGFRAGIGIHTSNRLSKKFNVGGYIAYGFGDKTLKYGGDLNFLLWKRKELNAHLLYENDVIESGGQKFFENRRMFSTSESYRDYYIRKMDRYRKYEFSFDWRSFKYFRSSLYANHQVRWSERGFLQLNNENLFYETDTFSTNEIGLRTKFIFREKFMETPRAKISLGSDFPVVYLNVSKGLKQTVAGYGGDFDFTKIDLRFDHSFLFRTIGKLNVCLQGGKVFGDIPYGMIYAMKGSFVKGFSVGTANTFETMRFNEFTASTFGALFLNHNVGKFLKKRKKFNPELELSHNMGWGTLDHPSSHTNIGIKTMEKGYFESGFRLNNLMKSGFSTFGFSAHYRYGPYALPTWKENLYVRMTIGFAF